MQKRLLSVMLALVLVFGMLPLPGMEALEAPGFAGATTVAEWNYTSVSPAAAPATGGENKAGAVLTNFKDTAPTYSTSSLCITDWTGEGDKYWKIEFSSKNFENLTISLAQRSSGTGPRNFKLQYSADGVNWSDVTGNPYDTEITSTALVTTFENVSLPAAINGLDTAYLRLLLATDISSRAGSGSYAATEQLASTGTSNINNIVISGTYTGEGGTTDPDEPAVISIAQARALGVGHSVVVEGYLTRALNSSGPVTNNFTLYVQDDTAGIAVYSSYAYTLDSYPVGTHLRVSGSMSVYTGILEIGGSGASVSIEVLSGQPQPRTPETITIAQLNSLAYEGKLVKVEGVTLSAIATNSNHTIRDQVSGAATTLRCTDGTTLPASEFAVNDIVNVIGIAANYNGTAQLMVSRVGDITIKSEEVGLITDKVVGWEYTSENRVTHFIDGREIPADGGKGLQGALAANTGVNTTGAEMRNNASGIVWYDAIPSFEAGDFGVGSYWEMKFSTKDFEDVMLASIGLRTYNGVRAFKLNVSVDGENFIPATASNADFTLLNNTMVYFSNPISLPAICDNQDWVWVRVTGMSGSTNWCNIDSVVFEGKTPDVKARKVTASPANGSIALNSTVALTCATDNATIYYAIGDGAFQVYSAPITMNILPATVRAYAAKEGLSASDESTFTYEQAKTAAVTARPGSTSKIALGSLVTLSCETSGAAIQYSLDGAAAQAYTAPIAINSLPATITAYATREGYVNGDPVTFTYTEKTQSTGSYTHYYGDLHNHTGYSDGASGSTPATAWASAKSRGLDFFAVTDHSNNLDSASALGNLDTGGGNGRWDNTIIQKNAANKDGEFTAISGYEFTWSSSQYGHINTLFYDDGFISRNNSAYTNTTNGIGIQAWYDKMAQYPNTINMYNHPGNTFGRFGTQSGGYANVTGNFLYWTEARDSVMHLIEVGNGKYNGPSSTFGNNNASGGGGYWRQWPEYSIALEQGWHIAPANNADEHGTGWANYKNCTVILAEELTLEALLDACLERRVYSTENLGITVDYTINGEIMGSRLQVPAGAPLEIKVEIAASNAVDIRDIGIVELITNGNVTVSGSTIATNPKEYVKIDALSGTATFTATATEEETFYYIRVRQNPQGANPTGNNESFGTVSQQEIWTITAPIWIEVGDAEPVAFEAETLT
ncbi:MAG: CehA/McbA family metallohydrolase, partial [Peptococcaceae bacterium]|nr:CehA/McbA family metallohydrolase [Peptococcaceae bacterium]